jgi:lipoprotein-releasing system ATP-binding protein
LSNIFVKAMAHIIEAKWIEKSFGALKVLKGIDFAAEKSEVVAIMGASGAGKSTLLQILGTLSTPDAGSLSIDGTDVLHLGSHELSAFRNRRIGFVFQFHHLLPEFTAIENVMIPAYIAHRSDKDAKENAARLLEDIGLKDRMDHKPSELSGGEQQRVAIARAIINSPAILYADEPTGNLDTKTKADIHQLFFDLRDKYGQTIVIVTHDPGLAQMCDRTLYMRDGQFVDSL